MNKQIKIWNIDINYKEFWEWYSEVIVILHWWWGKSDSWIKSSELLSEWWFRVIVPDLPWFWQTEINRVFTLDDYATIIENFIKNLKLDNIILWWHSNWGAISIKIANNWRINISRLVLNNSAWIRNDKKRSLKRLIIWNIIKPFKLIKNIPGWKKIRNLFYRAIWSHDYINAEENKYLKQTYLNMINSDLKEDISNISIDTLLIWWEEDTYTPLSDGNYMRDNIKKSKIVTLTWEKHWIHLHSPNKLINTFFDNI